MIVDNPLTANLLSNDKLKISNLGILGGDNSYIIHKMHTIDRSWSREKRGKACLCARGKKDFLTKGVSVTVCTE